MFRFDSLTAKPCVLLYSIQEKTKRQTQTWHTTKHATSFQDQSNLNLIFFLSMFRLVVLLPAIAAAAAVIVVVVDMKFFFLHLSCFPNIRNIFSHLIVVNDKR